MSNFETHCPHCDADLSDNNRSSDFFGSKEYLVCHMCAKPLSAYGISVKQEELIEELRGKVQQLSNEMSGLEYRVTECLPSAMRMREALLSKKMIEVQISTFHEKTKTYLRLTAVGLLETFYEEGWTAAPGTFDMLTSDVIQGRKTWEPCQESTVEIALLSTSKL